MQPSVTMVALYADRPEFADAILKVFRSQTYENKWLLIYDNGREPFTARLEPREALARDLGRKAAIGELRNFANTCAASDIIVHGDVDDWSHPNRISEQVALLQASGADVVGYSEMLFWETRHSAGIAEDPAWMNNGGRAWLYTSPNPTKPTLGTSLMYWRKTWERKPFNPTLPNNRESRGEDWDFIQGLNAVAVSSLYFHGEQAHSDDCDCGLCGPGKRTVIYGGNCAPRMIARIHGGNTTRYNIEDARGTSWRRVHEWDSRVRSILEGK